MARAIPDRWTEYKACGNVIEGTSFICFKVPLRKAVQQNRKEIDEIWDLETLVARIPGLGAVIDLTNTARYYDPSVLEAVGVRHKKIFIPGREIPTDSKVKEFTTAVDKFLKIDPGMIIGVHCTHGLNRTGYMVCRYMRDRLGIPAEDAIEKFETARSYHIERKNYLADLKGEIPPSPDRGRHTEVKPVKPRASDISFELDISYERSNGYPDKLRTCHNYEASSNQTIRSDVRGERYEPYSRKNYPLYVKPGDVERPRSERRYHGKKESNKDGEGETSWRNRATDTEAVSDFNNFGNHRPRQTASASGSRTNARGGRKMYGRPSDNSSKYAFDYRYDY